jgi:3,4-dihydroxy 2-butanone 4-phosphate synthase/GTP cyclohydrolase II
MSLMTNNPRKVVGLESFGLDIVERLPIEIPSNVKNAHYLQTKRSKLGHLLSLGGSPVGHKLESITNK